MPRPRRPIPVAVDMILAGVKVHPLGCWEHSGTLDRKGYGVIRADARQHKVHRLVYESEVGPIPEGLTIDHLCFNTRCCNPAHLDVVSFAENTRRRYTHRPVLAG